MADVATIRNWAEELLDRYGLAERGWTFGFDRAVARWGSCWYSQRRITLSRHIVHRDDEEIRQTLLHEIAHALAGRGAHHGPEWRRIAAAIGYRGDRIALGPVVPERWVAVCPNGHAVYRMRRPSRPLSCGRCSSRYDPRFALSWRRNPAHPGATVTS